MAMRVCPVAGCPTLTRGGRCPTHARPTSTQRGYDHAHRALRAAWAARINAGETVNCWRCGKPVKPNAWHLGHVKDERDTETQRARRWPEHDRECNLRSAGRSAHE